MVTRAYLLRKFGHCDIEATSRIAGFATRSDASGFIAKEGLRVSRRAVPIASWQGLTTGDHAAHGEAEDEQGNQAVDQERLLLAPPS
jgi:hypothetical protein